MKNGKKWSKRAVKLKRKWGGGGRTKVKSEEKSWSWLQKKFPKLEQNINKNIKNGLKNLRKKKAKHGEKSKKKGQKMKRNIVEQRVKN